MKEHAADNNIKKAPPADGKAQVLFSEYPAGPFKEIRKRDGRLVAFDSAKITEAIYKAARAVGGSDRELAAALTGQVIRELVRSGYAGVVPSVEEVQDAVEKVLIERGHARTAKAYILYRARRTRIREGKSELMDTVKEILAETGREDTEIGTSPAAKMHSIAKAASKKYYLSNLIPDEFARAHQQGYFHMHDLGYYSKALGCLQVDLNILLREGLNTGLGFLRPPRRISSAVAQAAIVLQSNRDDLFGEQGFPRFDYDMGALMRDFPEPASAGDVFQAMADLVYTLNSMHSRAGGLAPVSTLNLGTDTSPEGRLVTGAVLEALYSGLGRGESPLSPYIVFRVKKGVNLDPGDPNYDLFQRALQVAARRMNLTFSFMDCTANRPYGEEASYLGCRSRAVHNRHGPEVSAGRGLIAAVTLNLPRLALESRGRSEVLFVHLDRLMRLAARQLLHRFEVLSRLRCRDLPFLMGRKLYMGTAKLEADDYVGEALKNGILTVGFVGLAEALQVLAGRHHGEDEEALRLGMQIMERMRANIDGFAEQYDLNFALYAPPAGKSAGRFAALDRERHGFIPGVTDRERYTDSFHLPPDFTVSYENKVAVEGRFHPYCNAGHISYVELEAPPAQDPLELEKIIRCMHASNLGYGAVNFPLDECRSCSYSGLIGERCPRCGGGAVRRIRRVDGYLSASV